MRDMVIVKTSEDSEAAELGEQEDCLREQVAAKK
jgi:hypothetical protein